MPELLSGLKHTTIVGILVDAPSFFAAIGLSAFSVGLLLILALTLSCFVKLVTVLGVVRMGLGFGGLPSVFITGGLAAALSFFIMFPVLEKSSRAMDEVFRSSSSGIDDQLRARAFDAGLAEWKTFLIRHAHRDEIDRFAEIAGRIDARAERSPAQPGSVIEGTLQDSWRVLTPAFIVSELKEAFATGLSLFLPFLIVDLVVAQLLLAVGLDRMNPATVSFPFKLLLFVMVDGWGLISANLAATYG
jgi:flagellar biosynthesis protein FliP